MCGRSACINMHRRALGERPHMVDMPVIVRHQARGVLRLGHRDDQVLCRRRLSDLVFDHQHNAAMSAVQTTNRDVGEDFDLTAAVAAVVTSSEAEPSPAAG
jgi:hypothetical protein